MAAQSLGYRVAVLDPGADGPAASVADRHIHADYLDPAGLARLAALAQAVTTEFENVPAAALEFLGRTARVSPSAASVAIAQDRVSEKTFLAGHGFAVAPFAVLRSAVEAGDVDPALLPGIVKSARLGYDGKGQVRVATPGETAAAFESLGRVACVLERYVDLACEVSVVVARDDGGATVTWPVSENRHRNGILDVSIVPARVDDTLAARARETATAIAAALDYRGVVCVEMFITRSGELLLPRLLLIAEENSAVALIEDFESDTFGSPSVALPIAEIIMKAGAKVRHVVLQRWGRHFTHVAHQRALVGNDAFLHSLSIGLGAKLSKTNMESGLVGRGGGSELLGIFLGDENQQFDANTFQEHIGENTYSNLLYKAALRDASSSNYYGVIRIRPSGQGSNAYQADRNLLLGEKARADSVPVLEIEANDVKCTHGAAVGPVDEEHKFYLTSRAIPEPIAEQLIVFGFFHEVLDRFPDEVVRHQVDQLVAQKMGVQVEEAE